MDSQKPYWRDDQVVVDRDGIPHHTGAKPELMKEYRRRVLFAFSNLEGSGDDEEKEARSLAKKKRRFAKRLMDNLHDEAWRVCQDLLTDEKLKQPDGYKEVFRCLQKIEKVTVLKKTEAFDNFFDKTFRRRGQSVDAFLRQRAESWADLRDLSEGVAMSEDLLAYFLLKNVGLSKDEKRQVLLANQSDYSLSGFEKALRVSFFDIHEREKTKEWHSSGHGARKGGSKGGGKKYYAHAVGDESSDQDYEDDGYIGEDDGYAMATGEADGNGDDDAEETGHGYIAEGTSDQGASEDDEVYEAYATYRESRRKLKDIRKSRSFLRNKSAMSVDERKAAVEKEKARSRCAARGRLGHWAGDSICSKSSKGGPKGGSKGGRSGSTGKSKGKSSKGKAYVVSDAPMYFSLRQDDDQPGFCDMVFDKDKDEANKMAQDSGNTELDGKRKKIATPAASYAESEGWECVSPPYVAEQVLENDRPQLERQESEEQLVITVPKKDVQIIYVDSFQELFGEEFDNKLLRDLQQMCEKWGVQTSGKKDDVKARPSMCA